MMDDDADPRDVWMIPGERGLDGAAALKRRAHPDR